MQYLKTLPVLFSLMIVTIICALKTIAVKLVNKSGVDFHFAAAAQLTLAMAAGVVALLAWPGTLMYIWLPISTFLLPALAYWLTAVSPSSLRQRLCAALLTAAFFLCLPQTFASLRFQLRMDESVHLLAAAIAQLPEITDRTKSIGTPFLTPQSTEVGESIAAYTADTMTPGFIMGQKKSPIRANFFNVIWNSRNGSQSPPDLSKVTQDATIIDRSKDHNIDPGLVTFSLDMDDRVDTKYFWWRDRLKTGDILVIPFGSMSVSTVSYRGADMFSTDWQQKLMGLPQMQVSPYMTLNAPVIFGGRQMGWTLVRITHVSPIALAIQADGWLLQNAEIAVATSCVGKVLKLRSDMLLPTKLTCGHENETRTIAGQPDGQGGLVFSIPVPKSGNGNEVILRLTCADAPPSSRDDNRPFLLHLVEASVD